MKKSALITGITGQDGSYLAELLLKKGYKVHGLVRRVAAEDESHRFWRLRHLKNKINIHAGSLESYASIINIITKIRPHEIYHLVLKVTLIMLLKMNFLPLIQISMVHIFYYLQLKNFLPKQNFTLLVHLRCLVK